MMVEPLSRTLLLTLIAAALLPIVVHAAGETGSGRIGTGQCPEKVEAEMVYSPFKPYFKYPMWKNDVQKY